MQQLKPNALLQGGKYKIVSFLSSGGFGNTYEGVHTMMDTRVAIKELFPQCSVIVMKTPRMCSK